MMQTPINPYLKVSDVIDAYCVIEQVRQAALLYDPAQTRAITEQRHRLMWHLTHLTAAPRSQIAEVFRRDTSTVLEGVNKITDRMAEDPEFRQVMRTTRQAIIQRLTVPPVVSVDQRATAARVIAAASVLRDAALTDAEARQAALTILSSMMEAPGA